MIKNNLLKKAMLIVALLILPQAKPLTPTATSLLVGGAIGLASSYIYYKSMVNKNNNQHDATPHKKNVIKAVLLGSLIGACAGTFTYQMCKKPTILPAPNHAVPMDSVKTFPNSNKGEVYITLVQGNDLPCQRFVNPATSAAVNPANSTLNSGGFGEGAFIQAATGKASWGNLLDGNRKLWRSKGWQGGNAARGNAVISGAGELRNAGLMNYLIHAVGPQGDIPNRQAILRQTYQNILRLADTTPDTDPEGLLAAGNVIQNWQGLDAIALSLVALGSWKGNQPFAAQSQLVIEYVLEYLRNNPQSNLREVRFITYGQEEYDTLRNSLAATQPLVRKANPEQTDPILLAALNQSGVRNPTDYKPNNRPLIFTFTRQ